MKPIVPPLCNVTYAKDQPEYTPLPAYRDDTDPTTSLVTLWELSDDELIEVQKTKKIYLKVLTFNKPLQPLLLSVYEREVYTPKEIEKIDQEHDMMLRREQADRQILSIAVCDVCEKKSTWGGLISGDKMSLCNTCGVSTLHHFTPVPDQA